MATSVLLVSDQQAGRAPHVCVLTGEPTEFAVRVAATTWAGPRWLLGVPGFAAAIALLPGRRRCQVAIPVSERIWGGWRRRHARAVVGMVFGITLAAAGIVRSAPPMIALGALIAIAAFVSRTRAAFNYWITCRYQPAAGTITVQPTHPTFDAAARRLFTASLR